MKPKQLYITLLLISFSQTIFAKCPDAQVPQNLKANESHTKTTWYSESPPSTNNINNLNLTLSNELTYLNFQYNNLKSINTDNLLLLEYFNCLSNDSLQILKLDGLQNLYSVICGSKTKLIIKNIDNYFGIYKDGGSIQFDNSIFNESYFELYFSYSSVYLAHIESITFSNYPFL